MTVFRLSDYLERNPALVEQKQRYTTFKITPIGGEKEIIAWRAEQAKKLEALGARREETKAKAAEIVAGPDAPLGELSWKGKALLSDETTWADKLSEARWRRRKLVETEVNAKSTFDFTAPIEEPRKQNKLVAMFKNLWEAATASS